MSMYTCVYVRSEWTQQPTLLGLHHELKSSIYLATCTTERRHPRDILEDEERGLADTQYLSLSFSFLLS